MMRVTIYIILWQSYSIYFLFYKQYCVLYKRNTHNESPKKHCANGIDTCRGLISCSNALPFRLLSVTFQELFSMPFKSQTNPHRENAALLLIESGSFAVKKWHFADRKRLFAAGKSLFIISKCQFTHLSPPSSRLLCGGRGRSLCLLSLREVQRGQTWRSSP